MIKLPFLTRKDTMMKSQKLLSLNTVFWILCSLLVSQVACLDTIKQGEQLNFTSQLVSQRNNFTLGFYTPQDSTDSYVAVWYTARDSFPVWIGNRDNAVGNDSSPILTISDTGALIIVHHRENDPITLYAGGASRNASAILLESGNFVVTDGSSGTVLWQSFDYPTDTLLPGIKLGLDHRTGRKWILTSWFGDNNPASGPFTLEWDTSARGLVVRRRGVVYWTGGAMKDYYGESGDFKYQVKTFENLNFDPDPLNWNYNFTNVTTQDEEYFAYSLFQDPRWTPEDRKVISGWRLVYTGDISDTDNLRPYIVMVSLCYGYRPVGYKGCDLWQQPRCRNSRETFFLRSGSFLERSGLVASSVDVKNSSLSFSDCRENCWNNCDCFGFYGYESGCIYWTGKDLQFRQSLDGSEVRKYVISSISSDKGASKRRRIIIAVVVPIGLLFLGTALFLLLRFRHGKKREEEVQELLTLEGYTGTYELEDGGAKGHDLRLFTYASILAATDNFSSKNKLGEGGFGPVYKGVTPERHHIAVKVLSRSSGQGLLEFKNELILISKLQHINLVKLIGFSIHGDDKIIVYDYMPNKSLDVFLFDSSKRGLLDWLKRFTIIEGIAQGLLYLHKYSRLRIVHRDLKSGNILLDEGMNPKISDFGLARIFKQSTSEANTERRVGTYGYMAPEYAMQGIFSLKSDVYSFGVLVLEIVSGRKNNSFHDIQGPLNLVEHAWELWSNDSAAELMDPTLRGSCNIQQLHRCIHIGLLCVENNVVDRPSIEDVTSMLKNEMKDMPMPKNPAFITRNSVIELNKKISPQNNYSVNEISLTQTEEGR
ncbi:G-type lectin S-receptor-like serine/threonine-protein kinase At1g67520 [Primulina tabacum]|uniref:G-type lectin S-receptor-like serine/threonine-protein kinase At1g67520 n=1 Tax=Primulina tabacum TaxID=48773 RepID=UPI003F5A3D21